MKNLMNATMKMNVMQTSLRLLMVLLVLPMALENVWAGGSQTKLTLYYARLSASAQLREGGSAAKGLVYASTASEVPSDADYKPSMTAGPHNGGDANTSVVFYAWALPDRGFEFSSWEMTGASAPDSNGKITVDASSNQGDETNPKEITAAAKFNEVAPKQITYKGTNAGSYVVSYQYRVIDNKEFATKHDVYNITDAAVENNVESYKTDIITLTASPATGFLGWYIDDEEEPFSTSAVYNVIWSDVFATSATSYSVKPKWSEVSGNVAMVNGIEYTTLKEAINAANLLSNPTVTILQNIYSQPEQVEVTASMTIDLNGKIVSSMVNKMLCINNGANLTVQDGGSNGTISIAAALNERLYAVYVENGIFNLNSGIIEVENTMPYIESEHEETTASAVFVKDGATMSMLGGTIHSSAAYMAYGVQVDKNATLNIGAGTINAAVSQISSAYAVYAMGNATITGGTLSASSNNDACGVYADGNLEGYADVLISGGTVNATASESGAAGVRVADGHLTITNGTFNVRAIESASGVIAGAETITSQSNNGHLTIEGGTFNVNTANETTTNQYGVHIRRVLTKTSNAGYVTTTISGGTFNIGYASDAKKSLKSFGIYVNNIDANLGETGTIPTRITGGKFKIAGTGISAVSMSASAIELSGGSYQINTGLNQVLASGYIVSSIASGTADYTAGYRYEIKEGENSTAVCEVGGMSFLKLEDAISYVNNYPNQDLTILMKADYTLPAGYYTIPKKAVLLVPMSGQTSPYKQNIDRQNQNTVPNKAYCTLTLSEGVHLDVFGAIETGGSQNNYATSADGTGRPRAETYGLIIAKAGSDITLEDGAFIYAWGFIIGLGEIDVRRGATVYEQFQMYDFKGGRATGNMYLYDEKKVFPVNQYFIQNIEIPTVYRPGSSLWTLTAAAETNATVKILGTIQSGNTEPAMFLLDENDDSDDTWIRKYYDIAHDRQIYEVNNSAQISAIKLKLGDYTFDSRSYILPITNNMSIHLLTGDLQITQSTVMLAGAEIEIDKQAKVIVKSEQSLYLFDFDQWGKFTYSSVYAQRIKYSPSLNGAPTSAHRDISSAAAIGSAKLNVHGTFDIQGTIYTTASGANIFSTNDDAGTITFTNAAPTIPGEISVFDKQGSATGTKTAPVYYLTFPAVPALLRNEDPYEGSYYTSTAGTEASKSYCYMDKKWRKLTVDEDNSCFVHDQYGTYYAKAGEYVAINATKDPSTKKISGNNDNTYSDAAGTGRLFILCDGCQWWEVENVDNLYHCIHPQNDTYYYWVPDIDEETGIDNGTWVEKKYAISWQNWDGSDIYIGNEKITPYYLPYGAMPKFLSKNPLREADIDYTYNFTGWSPTITKVTEDKTYRATYEKEERRYVIVFKNGGTEVSRQFLKHNEMPDVPELTQEGKILSWNPMVSAVIGTQTYNAVWTDEPETDYDVQVVFKDYDGTVLKQNNSEDDAQFAVTINIGTGQGAINQTILDALPTPNKKQTDQVAAGNKEYNYVFDHWSPSIDEPVTQATVYTAVYREVAKTYTVNFYKEGTTNATKETAGNLIVSRLDLSYGATPEVPSYDKVNTDEYTYTKDWVNMSNLTFDGEGNITTDEDDWVKSVSSVIGNADYVAVFKATKNRYTITAKSEDANEQLLAGCTFSGTGTYDYDDENAITLTAIPNPGYEFVKWKDNNSTDPSRTIYVTSSTTYIAVVREANVEIDLNESQTIARPTVVRNLILHTDATSDESGQLIGGENISLVDGGNAYFDLTLNTWARHWHTFSVPFRVDLNTTSIVEVKTKDGEACNRTLRLGYDYDITYYNEATRATSGPGYWCWEYVVDNGKTLTPGQGYMIAFGRPMGTIRFTAVQDGDHKIQLGGDVNVTYTASENSQDGGWNAIGNPMTCHALLNAGVSECQVHNGDTIGSDGYLPYLMNGKFIVGKAVFVKAAAPQSVVVNRATTQSAITPKSAPRHANAVEQGTDRYTVEIASGNGTLADRLFVLTDEDKENQYEDIKDLPKAGISSTRAQMWVNRYGAKLCKNTIAMTDDKAIYPLSVYAPNSGEYTLYITTRPDDDTELYLTYDGEAIWNLSDGAYALNLNKGTNANYGLRISVKKAPAIATGIDEAVVDAKGDTRKVLINNHVLIIRGDCIYTIDGRLIK